MFQCMLFVGDDDSKGVQDSFIYKHYVGLFLDLTSIKCEDDSTQIHRQEGFLPLNKMWHHKDIKLTDLLNPKLRVKLEKDHSDDDIDYGETIVKQEDHSDDINYGETIVKQEDHSDDDIKDGETTLKDEKRKALVKEETGETRHWVVSDGGFLKETKKHHAWSVETSADENGRRVDNNIYVRAGPSTREACTSSAFTKDVTSFCHPNGRETIHAGVKAYICLTCGKSFSSISSHSRHCLSVHPSERPYACSICGKSFMTNSHCKSHEKIHMAVKPYACLICGKSYTQNSYLKMHERIHTTGVKSYVCSTCGESFSNISSHSRHKSVHTGKTPYACSTCGKSFATDRHCKSHENIHMDATPYMPV